MQGQRQARVRSILICNIASDDVLSLRGDQGRWRNSLNYAVAVPARRSTPLHFQIERGERFGEIAACGQGDNP